MPSPFPGMDPYLEHPAYWPDFHSRFINFWCEAIFDRLPDTYDARMGERVQIVEREESPPRPFIPDIAIDRGEGGGAAPQQVPGGVATLEPVTVPLLLLDEWRETYIEIRRRPDRSLVAVLELLSPSNKAGSDRAVYLSKRDALLRQDVHLVELDLLLGGRRLPLDGPLPPGDYYAFISRADRRFDCDVYAWSVRHPLPTLPVPLLAPDPDLLVDLQAIFATAYDRGRYARVLPYDDPPPGLGGADVEWVRERVRAGRGAGR